MWHVPTYVSDCLVCSLVVDQDMNFRNLIFFYRYCLNIVFCIKTIRKVLPVNAGKQRITTWLECYAEQPFLIRCNRIYEFCQDGRIYWCFPFYLGKISGFVHEDHRLNSLWLRE